MVIKAKKINKQGITNNKNKAINKSRQKKSSGKMQLVLHFFTYLSNFINLIKKSNNKKNRNDFIFTTRFANVYIIAI